MSRTREQISGKMFRLLLLIAMSAAASVAHSAPLLHAYPRPDLRIAGRTQSIATDGTNLLLSIYSEEMPSISTMLVRPDGSSSSTYNIAQVANRPYAAFNGANYLIAWIESPGLSASLRGHLIASSGLSVGSNFTILSGINALGLAGLSWD